MRRALPPVGVHRTVEQLLQTTTVWLWLKTVVLQTRDTSRISSLLQSPYRNVFQQHRNASPVQY